MVSIILSEITSSVTKSINYYTRLGSSNIPSVIFFLKAGH